MPADSQRVGCVRAPLKQGYRSSSKKFHADGSNVTAGSETIPVPHDKWLNVGPFGRSTAEAPQGDGVDGKGQPKLSSKVWHDEGYRQPSKNMAAASDTHSGAPWGKLHSVTVLRG